MPAYVPNYEFDVFVSYAHVDDESIGAVRGWVSTVIGYLKALMAQRLGRSDIFNIWFDRGELSGNDPITPEIHARLEKSATILIFLSPGYLASTWCQQELERFVNRAGENSSKIFVIELNKLDRPQSLKDLRGYQFWYLDENGHERRLGSPFPDPNDPNSPYYKRTNDVAVQLAEKLIELKKVKVEAVSPQVLPPPLATVFLAEVPPSLKEQRDDVRRYLEQQRVRIVPENSLAEIEDLQKALSVLDLEQARSLKEDLQNKLDQDLKTCPLFIQLLDVDVFVRLSRLQYNRAKALNIKVVQWRDPSLQVSSVADADHHKLLDGPEVQATKLTDFKAYLLRQLQPPPPSPAVMPASDDMVVFLNALEDDKDLAEKIQDILKTNHIPFIMPKLQNSGMTQENRKSLEGYINICNVVVLLYGNSPPSWVTATLGKISSMVSKRDRPLKLVAVYNEPKDCPKESLPVFYFKNMDNVQIIEKPFAVFKDELPKLLMGEAP